MGEEDKKGGLDSLQIKRAYNSAEDDVVDDFLCPCLERACEYKRVAGFFSSSALAIAARGVAGLINNDGAMQLVTSASFQKDDFETIQKLMEDESELNRYLVHCLDDLGNLEDDFERDHYFALAWMLANERLEIRIAVPEQKDGIFHPKVGIISDSCGKSLSFSGSINESASAWCDNIEEFKVFKNWESDVEKELYSIDSDNFFKVWNPQKARSIGIKTINLPLAIKEHIIKDAPKDFPDLSKYYRSKLKKKKFTNKPRLFENQIIARDNWLAHGKRGIISMATGTGKTITALSCIDTTIGQSNGPLLIIITCPYAHLLDQWASEIDRYGILYDKMVRANKNGSWRDNVSNLILDLENGYFNTGILLVTNITFCIDDFREIIKINKNKTRILIVSDEMHGLGAPETRKGLIEAYDDRLGLSATPSRYSDEEGTDVLFNYFGGIIFEFDLFKALTTLNPSTGETYLTPYDYRPIFVSLNNDELDKYLKLTKKIIKNGGFDSDDDFLKLLCFKRADIVKNASNKLSELSKLLDSFGHEVKHTLIYCNPGQIDDTMRIVKDHRLVVHRFTGEEGTLPENKYNGLSERAYILSEFQKGTYQVLVAMKCLDEGVDVPAAYRAILMANSGNPREHIQRIGRVIRRFKDKKNAEVHDLVVVASGMDLDETMQKIEKKIIEKELTRCEEIALNASNSTIALSEIYSAKRKYVG